jgi:hypothetical protein
MVIFTKASSVNVAGATQNQTTSRKVTSVKLNKTLATLSKAGATLTLTATVSPSNASNKALTWKSSNTKVATVTSTGKVKAVGEGTCIITATAKDGSGKKASANIQVSYAKTISIDTLAPKAPAVVRNAFKTLDFKIITRSNVPYTGYFQPSTRSIILNSAQINSVTNAIYHELGHFTSFISKKPSYYKEFEAIFQAELSKLPGKQQYASQNAYEYYACAFQVYVTDPAALKKACPKTYQYIQAGIKTITSSRINTIKSVCLLLS